MQENQPITVTIVGGGNSTHVLIPFLKKSGHKVNLMTRRPADWQDTVKCELHCDEKEDVLLETLEGKIDKKSSNPADVIPDADAIILCMPVHQYRDALHRLGPYINKAKEEVFVGTIYGQGLFNMMVHEVERKLSLQNVVTFAIGLIPWICRTVKYGALGSNYGCKLVNLVAVTPANKFEKLNEVLLNDICYTIHGKGKFMQACSFISLSLSVDNQMIHPSRCYGLWKRYGGRWPTAEDIPFFYKDFDDISADNMDRIDQDYSAIRNAIRKHFPDRPFNYMLDYLSLERFSHGSWYTQQGFTRNFAIQESFKCSKQLSKIKTPTVKLPDGPFMLDIQCRFFTDDIPYGLLIAKWIAQELNVETPFIDEVIMWAQELRGWHFFEDGKINIKECLKGPYSTGIPPVYGFTSVDEILD